MKMPEEITLLTDIEGTLVAIEVDGKKVAVGITCPFMATTFLRKRAGWANDPDVAPLKNELQRLRTELEQKQRELSNARVARDEAETLLRRVGR